MSAIIKAIAYCRVSTKEQADEGYSLEAQEKLLCEYATKHNLKVVKIYKIAETASKDQIRKLFKEVFEYANKHKIDVILCEKIDRLTRNPKDAGMVDDWVSQIPNREIHFVKESFVLNGKTKAHENLVWDMKVAIARFYTNNLSEEVHKGQFEKLAQGWMPAKPIIGYKTIGEKGHKTHIIDEQYAPYIRSAFERYATGNYSLSRLESELHDEGFRSRSGKMILTGKIHKILTYPFYHGAILWMGKIYPGKHEPIVSKDLFGKVQVVLRNRMHPHFTKHTPIFKAKMKCEHCGGLITWELQKGHWYGHCNNHGIYRQCSKKTYIRQEKVEEQIMVVFDKIAPKTQEVLDWIEENIKAEHQDKIKERENQIQRLNSLLSQVRRRKDQVYLDKIDNKVSVDFYERKFADFSQEEKDLEESLAKLNDQSDEYQQLGVAIHELAYNAKAIYEQANPDEKRLLLSQLFTNLIQNQHEIKPNYTLAAEYLATWMPRLPGNYEPPKMANTKEKTPARPDVDSYGSELWRTLELLYNNQKSISISQI